MKRLFILLAVLIAFAASASAQDLTVYKYGTVTTILNDTVNNTGTADSSVLIKMPDKEAVGYSIHVIAANLSGTTDIDVSYQWSNDATNWLTHTTDSLASGNLQYIYEDITGVGTRYIKVSATGVGTQSSTIKAYLYTFRVPGK